MTLITLIALTVLPAFIGGAIVLCAGCSVLDRFYK
jgi:hypothetical protein